MVICYGWIWEIKYRTKFNFIRSYEPYNVFSSYPTETINDSTNFRLIDDNNLDKNNYIFQSDSINIVTDTNQVNVSKLDLRIDFEEVNLVVDAMKNTIKSYKEISRKTNISISRLNRILSTMLKFNIIEIVEKK